MKCIQMLPESQQECSPPLLLQNQQSPIYSHANNNQKETLESIVNSISFEFKPDKKKKYTEPVESRSQNNQSFSISFSSEGSMDRPEKSKLWTLEQQALFNELYEKHGTDFNYIRKYFPKKSKNQIKNKYKQILNNEKKRKKNSSKVSEKKEAQALKNRQDELPNIQQELDFKFENKGEINLVDLLEMKMESESPLEENQ